MRASQLLGGFSLLAALCLNGCDGSVSKPDDGGVDAIQDGMDDGDAGQDADGGADAGDPGVDGGDPGADAGDPGTDAGDPGGDGVEYPAGWLRTEGNRILDSDGQIWHGRGANLHDTRSCWACAAFPPDVEGVKRRVEVLVDEWGANLVRLCLESYPTQENWMVQWQGVLDDPEYLADVIEIIEDITARPGVYVLLSLWTDPSFTDQGWPTQGTNAIWERLAETFAHDPQVIFGLVNEPQSNFDGAQDAQVWQAMDTAVAAIRAVEAQQGSPAPHLVAVQGTRAWARRLDYYVDHPIAAGGGVNVLYETHVYDPQSEFQALFIGPAQALPVIIGEFGPAQGYMTEADCTELMDRAQALHIPHLAWTFHDNCPPNLLEDTGSCGADATFTPTSWGTLVRDRLALPW